MLTPNNLLSAKSTNGGIDYFRVARYSARTSEWPMEYVDKYWPAQVYLLPEVRGLHFLPLPAVQQRHTDQPKAFREKLTNLAIITEDSPSEVLLISLASAETDAVHVKLYSLVDLD
jgi:hypothetical protein